MDLIASTIVSVCDHQHLFGRQHSGPQRTAGRGMDIECYNELTNVWRRHLALRLGLSWRGKGEPNESSSELSVLPSSQMLEPPEDFAQ